MHLIVLLAIAGAALAGLPSGYEAAEMVQPAPPPISSDGGDQQGYNSDAGTQAPAPAAGQGAVAPPPPPAADQGAPPPPPPPPPSPPPPPPPAPSAPADQGGALPPPPPSGPAPGGDMGSSSGGYRHRFRAYRLH